MSTRSRAMAANLLRQAAAVLEAKRPQSQVHFNSSATSGGGGEPCLARFDFPGVVSVFDRNTGELLVKSMPGRPCEPDFSSCGVALVLPQGAEQQTRSGT